MLVLSPLLQETSSELESSNLGLAERNGVELFSFGEILEQVFNHLAESAHAETHVVVGCGPHDVVVREVDLWTLVKGFGESADVATF